MASSRTAVFVYTGQGEVPTDVTIVHFFHIVTHVSKNAFRNCPLLREVVLNEGLLTIGTWAFADCVSLKSITLPSTVTHVGKNSFHGCHRLREVVLNEGLLTIGDAAFVQCLSLRCIKLPSTVTMVMVGEEVFALCCGLRMVVLNEGLQKIGWAAFIGCVSLENIMLPSTITNVAERAFCKCANLRKVELNEGLLTIGKYSFAYCSQLESIKLPSTVTEVDKRAFEDCTELREVVLNKELQTIRDSAFDGCLSLEILKFPCIFKCFDTINMAGQTEVLNKINVIPAVSRKGDDLLISRVLMGRDGGWETHRASVRTICGLITYHELKEATTIIELSLWKAKIEEESATIETREACRVEVPGPVKDAILQYFSYNRG